MSGKNTCKEDRDIIDICRSKIGRRAFLLLPLFTLGCASSPKTVEKTITQPLPPVYRLPINPQKEFTLFEGQSVRVDSYKTYRVQETYIDKYSANAAGFSDTFVEQPIMIFYYIFFWPFALLATGIAGAMAAFKPDQSKYLKKERVVTNSETIHENVQQRHLEDGERAINIVVSSSGKFMELIVVNTNKQGNFIFNFEKSVIDSNLPASDYKIEFYHKMLDSPVSFIISSSTVKRVKKANAALLLRTSRTPRSQDMFSQDRTDWFSFIELAFSVKGDFEVAKEIYVIYREYKFERVFFVIVFRRVLPNALLSFAVETAIIEFTRWLLVTYRKELITFFGEEVDQILPV